MKEDFEYNLIREVADGDRSAFETLVRRYQGPVYSFICRYLADRHAAEDLTQEVFLRVFRGAPRFEPRGKVSTWIFTIAYNLSVNEIKRRRRDLRLRDEFSIEREEYGGCACSVDDACRDIQEDLMAALDQLPENQRAALLLRVNEGLSYQEIAKVLSVSRSSVESLLFRARVRLREILKKRGD